jgi:Transglycosylase SLT domain
MNQNHLFTNVVAVLTLLLVLLVGGTAIGTGHAELTDPSHLLRNQSSPFVEVKTPHVHSTDVGIFSATTSQSLKTVYLVGREVGNPETLQAILLQETRGGQTEPIGNKDSPVGKRSYGLMQVQVVAARSIFTRYSEVYQRYFPTRKYDTIADEEIIALLLTNDEANIRIAAYHFKLYLQLSSGDWDRAVAAYNAGIGAVNNIPIPAEFDYVIKVKAKMETEVRTFNRKHGLQLTQRF